MNNVWEVLEKVDDVIWEHEEEFLKRFAPKGAFELLGTAFTSSKILEFTSFVGDHVSVIYDCKVSDLKKWFKELGVEEIKGF